MRFAEDVGERFLRLPIGCLCRKKRKIRFGTGFSHKGIRVEILSLVFHTKVRSDVKVCRVFVRKFAVRTIAEL